MFGEFDEVDEMDCLDKGGNRKLEEWPQAGGRKIQPLKIFPQGILGWFRLAVFLAFVTEVSFCYA